MLLTLIMIKHKKNIWYTSLHSSYLHLKVLKNIVTHFRYDGIGCDIGTKNNIKPKELMNKISKIICSSEDWRWDKYKGLRELDFMGEGYDGGYILIKIGDYVYNNYININLSNSTSPSDKDDKLRYELFKRQLEEFKK